MLSVLKQRFEVVITVTVQFTVLLHIQPRSLVDISGSFKETYCLHLAGRSFFTLVIETAYSCGTRLHGVTAQKRVISNSIGNKNYKTVINQRNYAVECDAEFYGLCPELATQPCALS
jgi:hypothetical protein